MNMVSVGLSIYLLIGAAIAYLLIFKSDNFDDESAKFSVDKTVWFAIFTLFWVVIVMTSEIRKTK